MSEISNWSKIVYVEPDSYSGDASNDKPDDSEDSFLSWELLKLEQTNLQNLLHQKAQLK